MVSACNPLATREGIQTTLTLTGNEEEWEKEQKVIGRGGRRQEGRGRGKWEECEGDKMVRKCFYT